MIDLDQWNKLKAGDKLVVSDEIAGDDYVKEVRHLANAVVTVDAVHGDGSIGIEEDKYNYRWRQKNFSDIVEDAEPSYIVSISDLI